jgi:hypothetical protein
MRNHKMPFIPLCAILSASVACAAPEERPSAHMLVAVQAAHDALAPGGELAVVSRGFGGGYARFELSQAVDETTLDLAATQLFTLGSDGSEHDVTGQVFLDDDGKALWIQLAEAPRPGAAYHARTALVSSSPEVRPLELGTVFIGASPGAGAPDDVLFVAPSLLSFEDDTLELVFAEMEPAHGSREVARDIGFVTMRYNSPLDCDNPIRGEGAFKIYSDNPALGRQQVIFDQQAWFTPGLVCDPVRNEISLQIPGNLVGGSLIRVETRARGLDGSELAVNSWFWTKNPGLAIYVMSVDNQISNCDTWNPFSDSENCDVYVVSRAKPQQMADFQVNMKLPQGMANWDDWAGGGHVSFGYPQPLPVLYMDATPLGDPFMLELQAFDADSGDGLNRVLSALGGVGKIAAVWWPPAGPIGEGLSAISQALPHDDDDPLGSGTLFFSRMSHWGTRDGWQTLRVPGRAFGNQIVLNAYFQEYPQSYYFQIIE